MSETEKPEVRPVQATAPDTPAPVKADASGGVLGVVTGLATLPAGAHLDAAALGRMLGRCRKSIQRAARRGELPPPIKFLGHDVWLAGTIQEHLATRQQAAVQHAARREQGILRHSA